MNNIVTSINGNALTTSMAIAEGVGRPHASVIKIIRNNQSDFEYFGPIGFEIHKGKPLDQGGFAKSAEIASLNEQQATLLMTYMRNTPVIKDFKKTLVRAFYELARVKPIPAELNRMDILQMAMDAEKDKLSLKHEVEILKPKADFADQVAIAEDAISLAEAAKLIGTGRNRLSSKLKQMGWITRNNEPYQAKITAGLMDVKLGSWDHPGQGLKQSVTPLVTGKGLVELQRIYKEAA